MIIMAKKFILALIILILLIFGAFLIFSENTVDVYIDGENVSVETKTLSDIDAEHLNAEICDLALDVMNDTASDATTLKNRINDLCHNYGLDDAKITIDSPLGEDQIPVIVNVDGTSMVPTLQDGQTALMIKTHNIHVGDIVVADSDEYGGIIKRVDQINGNNVHLASDNKEVSYENVNGVLYEVKGISTWVDISDINGVVIDY
jgi:hypothetical protein